MQSRFAGDIGDFGKYGLLRALARPPLRLGMIWYRTPDGESGGDRTGYLEQPQRYRPCDPALFDALSASSRQERSIFSLISSGIFPPDTCHVKDPVPSSSLRWEWYRSALSVIEPCQLVFLDPDNGLAPPSVPRTHRRARHYVYPEEIASPLGREQSVLFYHHLSRREPARVQIRKCLSRFDPPVLVLRFHRGGSRVFVLLPAPSHQTLLKRRVHHFLETPWKEHFTLDAR